MMALFRGGKEEDDQLKHLGENLALLLVGLGRGCQDGVWTEQVAHGLWPC